jgi:hemerythrin superfamily protein
MASAVDLVRQDHQRVRSLFDQFQRAVASRQKKEIAEQTVMELEVHAKLEEHIFYPAVRQMGGLDPTMNEAEEEHHAAKLLALEVARMDPENPYFAAKYHVLKEMVLHHMQEEESQVLPRAQELGEERLAQLGEEMERRRLEFLDETRRMLRGDLLAMIKGLIERTREATGRHGAD